MSRSLTVSLCSQHQPPINPPSLRDFVARFPSVKSLCIEWSYGSDHWPALPAAKDSDLPLSTIEELILDLRGSKHPRSGAMAVSLVLAHLGLSSVRKLQVLCRCGRRTHGIDFLEGHPEVLQSLGRSLDTLPLDQLYYMIEAPVNEEDFTQVRLTHTFPMRTQPALRTMRMGSSNRLFSAGSSRRLL